MLQLIISLPFGQIEKRFPLTVGGRAEAYQYMRLLVKQRQQILSHKLIKIKE